MICFPSINGHLLVVVSVAVVAVVVDKVEADVLSSLVVVLGTERIIR